MVGSLRCLVLGDLGCSWRCCLVLVTPAGMPGDDRRGSRTRSKRPTSSSTSPTPPATSSGSTRSNGDATRRSPSAPTSPPRAAGPAATSASSGGSPTATPTVQSPEPGGRRQPRHLGSARPAQRRDQHDLADVMLGRHATGAGPHPATPSSTPARRANTVRLERRWNFAADQTHCTLAQDMRAYRSPAFPVAPTTRSSSRKPTAAPSTSSAPAVPRCRPTGTTSGWRSTRPPPNAGLLILRDSGQRQRRSRPAWSPTTTSPRARTTPASRSTSRCPAAGCCR